jgi:hypothetical protein
MSNRHILYLLLAIAGVTLASAILLGSEPGRNREDASSTYSTHPKGCKALFLLLERLHLPAERFGFPFRRLGRSEGVLLVIEPRRTPFDKSDVARLEEWIKKGNRLVMFQGAAQRKATETKKQGTDYKPSDKERRSDRSTLAYRFGLREKKTHSDTRSTCPVSTARLPQIQELNVSDSIRWEKPPEGWDVLVADAAGPLIVAKKLGDGEIVAVADPTIVQNRYLSRAQNARLVIALIGREKLRQTILFDEYHHGHVVQESFWHYTATSVFAWILFQCAVGLLLYIFSRRASQSGRFQSLAMPAGRSSMEYVDSMANVLSSCKAGSLALEMLLQRFLGRVSRKRGIPLKDRSGNARNELLMQALGDTEAADVVVRCDAAIDSAADPAAALRLAGQLQETYRRFVDSHGQRVSSARRSHESATRLAS